MKIMKKGEIAVESLTIEYLCSIVIIMTIMKIKFENLRFFWSSFFLVCWISLGLKPVAQGQSYGLDSLAPVGKFLDNKLPATTPGGAGAAQPPALLSQVGAFSNLAALTPRGGLIPYTVNSPLWTDGAFKQRWLAVPNDGTADTAAEKITFTETGAWQFPKGSVLVKQFDLPIDDRNSAVQRRMETRFLVHGDDGVYYGITYRWRADGLEADLLPDGDNLAVAITTASGGTRSQTWTFPSRADCRTCHNAGAGTVLGPRTHQMNGSLFYPATGRTDNQLRALNHLNLFSPSIQESAIANYPKTVTVTDSSATLEHRVRSYLEANCAHCHYPGNPANPAGFDARFSTPIVSSNIIGGIPLYDLGLPNARIVVPQNTASSVMYYRMSANGLHQMPPIGRNTVDSAAVSTLSAWINALPVLPPATTNQSPVAVNDEVSTLLNTAVNITVLANDSDADGDVLTIGTSTTPTNGTVTGLPGNILRFTPDNGFTGTATFQYTILDNRGGSAAATVSVRVLPPATSNSVAFFDGSSRLSAPNSYSGVAMAVADMNQDGLDDVVHLRSATRLRIDYQSPGGGAFTFRDVGSATSGNQWCLSLGDADNNGYPDILVAGLYDGVKYYRANSSASAYSLTTLAAPSIFAQSLGFVDINRDGWLDIFACHDEGECARFRNTGDGSMVVDPTLINPITGTPSDNSGNYGIVWTDYDNDGDIDLYLTKCRLGVSSSTDPRRINQLFRNNGNGTFTDVAAAAGLAFGEQSWTADFADIDNDGDLDCYVGNHGAVSYLMRNNGNGTFTNITNAAGLGSVSWMVIQSIFRDFNNDGFMDLLLTGQQQQVWINQRNSTFSLMPNRFISTVMESCAVGDLNKDGITDIYAGYATIYNTPSVSRPDKLFLAQNNGNNFLSVTLRGVASNTTASGARLELYGPWGVQLREVRSGDGYAISNSFTQLFGMGNTGAATKLKVRWPSGYVEEALNVLPNQFLTLREGSMAAPSLTSPGNLVHFRNETVDFTLASSDPTGDALRFTATGLPPGLTIGSTTGRITGTIANTSLNSYTTAFSVTDGWSTVTRSITWNINGASAPSVTLTTNSGTVAAAFDISVNFTAAVSGLTLSDFTVSNGSASQLTGSAATYTVRINPTAAGPITVALPANAATAVGGGLGNVASSVLPVTFMPGDTTRPSVTLSTVNSVVSGAFTVTATFNEAVSGLSSGELSVTNGTASAPAGTGTAYSWSVTPSAYGNITVALPANSVSDAAGNPNTVSNTLTVSWPQPNRAPVVTNPGSQSSVRGTAVTLVMQGFDPDGQSLTWGISGQPLGLSINSSTGLVSGNLSASAAATYNVTVSASDGSLATSVSFTWSTTAPAAASNGLRGEYYSGPEPGVGVPLLVRTDANIDFEWGNGSPAPAVPNDNFSVRWTGTLTAMYSELHTFWVPSDNGVRIWLNNVQVLNKWTPADVTGWHTFDFTLTANQAVSIKVEYAELYGGAGITMYWYSASQAWEAINTSRFRTSNAVNQAPMVTTPGTQTTVRGRPATLTIQASDPEFNPLTWSATGLPSGLTINSASGVISGTVSPSAAATNSVSVSVSDGSLIASANFVWNTTAPPTNAAPVVYDPGTQTSIRGSIVTLQPMATDSDGDGLTWSAAQLPAGLSMNAATGFISGTILTTAATSYGTTLTVRDPGGLTGSVSFTWNTIAPALHGLRAEYFHGPVPGVAAPLLVRTDATINFDWGGGSPAPGVPADQFSARWTGLLTAPFTETYSIYVPSDNGVRVWLNNQLVLDKWSPVDITGWHNFTIPLAANQAIPIRVEYAETYGGAAISIFWFSDSQQWEIINSNRLTPTTVLPPNSAETATSLISRTQRLEPSPNLGAQFTFRRPSSSANLLALLIEESEDLTTWNITDYPAQIVQLNDGTEEVTVPVSTPEAGSSLGNRFYRVRFLVP